jgi:hypothetical protein
VRLPGGPLARDGPMVQRDDAAFARRRSGFDSRRVHCERSRHGVMVQQEDTALAWRRSGCDSR